MGSYAGKKEGDTCHAYFAAEIGTPGLQLQACKAAGVIVNLGFHNIAHQMALKLCQMPGVEAETDLYGTDAAGCITKVAASVPH